MILRKSRNLAKTANELPVNQNLRTLCTRCLYQRSHYTSISDRKHSTTTLTRGGLSNRSTVRTKTTSTHMNTTNAANKWEVTVGLEIHAQLNAKRKLFSFAKTSFNATPNTHVAMFDAAIPALRAAVALKCHVNHRSTFDRKHYFYKDQPCGYQITQFYEALANDGHITLTEKDGLSKDEGEIVVGIKQVQLEQDTAKSLYQQSDASGTPSRTLIDLNRAASPLIEIITTPSLHSSQQASVCLKKIQGILKYSQAAIHGMEKGGIRCDVNVSICEHGAKKLGQRVEIKNLNSVKAVQESIDSEVERQMGVLERGGVIEGETRGWDALTGTSKKLRGKEGEVDYRYMPDAEIPALVLDEALVEYVRASLPKLPEQVLDELLAEPYALTLKDARSLMALDEGARIQYYTEVVERVNQNTEAYQGRKHIGKLVGNWILHELGGWLSAKSLPWSSNPVTPDHLVYLLSELLHKRISSANAKYALDLLTSVDFIDKEGVTMADVILEYNLAADAADDDQEETLIAIAEKLVAENEKKAQQIRSGKKIGLINFFVGQMMRETNGKADVEACNRIVRSVIFGDEDHQK